MDVMGSLVRRVRSALGFTASIGVAAFAFLGLLTPATHAATTITVTTTADDTAVNGTCSLREAVQASSTRSKVDACAKGTGGDTITLPAGTYMLSRVLTITSSMTIRGAGASSTRIKGSGTHSVLSVNNKAVVVIDNVTITNGKSTIGGGLINHDGTVTITRSTITSNTADVQGGGIYNGGLATLVVSDSTISGNSVHQEGGGIWSVGYLTLTRVTITNNSTAAVFSSQRGSGGGIFTIGTTTIKDSTISGNRALRGGGIRSSNGRDDAALTISGSTISGNNAATVGGGLANGNDMIVTITNSTIAGNSAATDGGGIWNSGACGSQCIASTIVWLKNSTVAGNTADSDANGSGNGGGLFNGAYDRGSRIRVANTIVANNLDRSGQAPDVAGKISSYGYNLIRSTKGSTLLNDQTGNIYSVDPKLGALASNGGSTKTMALLAGSKARDAGNPQAPATSETACTAKDQRGTTRPRDGNADGKVRCDIGAYEARSSTS